MAVPEEGRETAQSPLGERHVERYTGVSHEQPAIKNILRMALEKAGRRLASIFNHEPRAIDLAGSVGGEVGEMATEFVSSIAQKQAVENEAKRAEVIERLANAKLASAKAEEAEANARHLRSETLLNNLSAVEKAAELLTKDVDGTLQRLKGKYGDVEVKIVDGKLVINVGVEGTKEDI